MMSNGHAERSVCQRSYGGDFGDNLGKALVNMTANRIMGALQHEIGDLTKKGGIFDEGGAAHVVLHSIVGCASAQATGSSCEAGAAAAAAQALYAGVQDGREGSGAALTPAERAASDNLHIQTAGLLGGIAAALAGDGFEDFSLGQSIAQSGFENNYLWHEEALRLAYLTKQAEACGESMTPDCQAIRLEIASIKQTDADRDARYEAACGANSSTISCLQEHNRLSELAFGEPHLTSVIWSAIVSAYFSGHDRKD